MPKGILFRITVQRETQVGAGPSFGFATPSFSNESSNLRINGDTKNTGLMVVYIEA